MENRSSSGKCGIGFCGLLTIVFIALKLMGYINWNWILVFSPLWGGAILWLLIIVVLLILLHM